MEDIRPITMPGTHKKFMEFFKTKSEPLNLKILDLGAGHGALSKSLFDMGYNVQACDLFPEMFRFEKVECKKVDITDAFPYPDNTFDLVIAIEVSEHILDHEMFFRETSRILKPDGKFYISTPNILSMKSRVRFLFRGYPYSFKRLEQRNYDGLQHVASLSLDQYNYIAVKNNFKPAEFEIDRKQSTSQWLLIFLFPLMLLNRLFKRIDSLHNHKKLLLGRLLFLVFNNDKTKE
jgi:SAM-dependent methyltransferase